MIASASDGDWREWDAGWDMFVHAFESHLTSQSERVRALIGVVSQQQRRTLEHVQQRLGGVRKTLEELGVLIQLKAIHAPRFRATLEALRNGARWDTATIACVARSLAPSRQLLARA